MDIDYLVKSYLQNYDQLIEQLLYLSSEVVDKKVLANLHSETKDKKWIRGINFSQLLKDDLLDLFIESKIKLFSHKEENTKLVSEVLFGHEMSLKKVFNNKEDSVKVVLWSYLHLMVLMIELAQKKKNKEKIKKITKVVEENVAETEKCKKQVEISNKIGGKDPKNMIKDMLGVEVNEQTNDMVADIVNSFEHSLQGGANTNPIAGILEISRKISEKYQDKITSGDIQLEKLMEGIQKTIPGMDKILGGENGMSDMMKNMMGGEGGDMANMMKNMMGGKGGGGMADMMKGMMGGAAGGLFGKEPKKETVIIDENFSTSNVDVGVIKEGANINIGKMLNVANSLGVIPSFKSESEGSASSGQPNIMELFGMMKGINNIKTKEEASELKSKVDNFIETKLGLDMSKISKDMEKMLKPKTESAPVDEETNKEITKLMESMD
jgi:hypothetical protein